jgi:hypothetical protein
MLKPWDSDISESLLGTMMLRVPDIVAMQCITYVMLVWIFASSGEVMLDRYRQIGPSTDDDMYDREHTVYQHLTEMNSFEEIIGVILITVPNRTHIVDFAWLFNSHEKFKQCYFLISKATVHIILLLLQLLACYMTKLYGRHPCLSTWIRVIKEGILLSS